MAKFCVNTVNGKKFYNIELHDHGGSREPTLGSTQRFPLTDDQLEISLDDLIKIFTNKDNEENMPSWEKDPALKAAMIARIAVIITQLKDDDGTKDVARRQYKRLTGVDFKMP